MFLSGCFPSSSEPGTSAWCSDLASLVDALKAQVPNIYLLSDITLTGPLPAVSSKITITGFCQPEACTIDAAKKARVSCSYSLSP